jgi:hypothetical protein
MKIVLNFAGLDLSSSVFRTDCKIAAQICLAGRSFRAMKSCQKCGHQNEDAMRFCLECGTPLPDAPIIVSWQDSGGGGAAQRQSNAADTASYGHSMQTRVKNVGGGRSTFGQDFSAAPTPPRPGGNKKLFIAVGGIAALFLLIFAAGAAIVGYNLIFRPADSDPPRSFNPTPPITPTRSPQKSPSPKPSPSPSLSPTASPVTDDDVVEEPPPDYTPPTPQKNAPGEYAKLKRMWVDYNVTEKGRQGMRIHVSFSVYNMKGVGSYLAIYFQKKDGSRLLSNNDAYRSRDGRVAVFKLLKPGYDNTVYEDEKLFMPYDELNLRRGKYDLQMDVNLIYENGEMIEHINTYDFQYEKF